MKRNTISKRISSSFNETFVEIGQFLCVIVREISLLVITLGGIWLAEISVLLLFGSSSWLAKAVELISHSMMTVAFLVYGIRGLRNLFRA